jgi:two-component system NarL family response regulator
MPTFHPLTERETEILHLITTGKQNKEIAGALGLAERTVEQHLTNLYRKLGVSNRTEAAIQTIQGAVQHAPDHPGG